MCGHPRCTHLSVCNQGFVLIELMVAIAIVAIVSQITIPKTSGERIQNNEEEAIKGIRQIAHAQDQFLATDPDGYGVDYAETLEELEEYGLIDNVLEMGTKSGYYFELVKPESGFDRWSGRAFPFNPGNSGNTSYSGDDTGRIRTCEPGYIPVIHPRTGAVTRIHATQTNNASPSRIGIATMEALHLLDTTARQGALFLLRNPAFIADVLRELDQNTSTDLTFAEQSDPAQILATAQSCTEVSTTWTTPYCWPGY